MAGFNDLLENSHLLEHQGEIVGVGAFVAVAFALLLIKRIVWSRLRLFTRNTSHTWDEELLDALHRPTHLLIFVLALQIGLQFFPAAVREHSSLIVTLKVLLVTTLFWIALRAVSTYLMFGTLPIQVADSTRRLLSTIAKLGIFAMGMLVVLDTVGVSITPLLASLGVGSLAVALALQDTFSNFFSGIYLLIDKPVRIGDYVKIDESVEGFVRKIGWRSTHIELLSSNTVVIPNSKLAASTLTNYDLPLKELGVGIKLGVGYECDLNQVERVTLEVAREVAARVPGAVASAEPSMRFTGFGDSSIDFSVGLKVQQFTDQYLLKHELIKALHARFQRENISIPFPQRVVHLNSPAPPPRN